MEQFFNRWFLDINEGLSKMSEEECSRLFSKCAASCAKDALKHLYAALFYECDANLDTFFSRIHEVNGVDGCVVESGKVFDIIFKECNCPLHTEAHINCVRLCECSRQSILCELNELIPERQYEVVRMESILDSNPKCRFRITVI